MSNTYKYCSSRGSAIGKRSVDFNFYIRMEVNSIDLFEIIKSSLLNTGFIALTFLFFGVVFNVIEKLNNEHLYYAFGRRGVVVTGFIGTVVHELSHYALCLVFRHKVTEVRLFRPVKSEYDGVLGYVKHKYNRESFYQNLGNFFIGIAPLIGGTLSIFFIFKLLLPGSYNMIADSIKLNMYVDLISKIDIAGIFNAFTEDMLVILEAMFSRDHILSVNFIVFIFLMYSISTHMTLSKEDFENSMTGFGLLLGLVFGLSVISKVLGHGIFVSRLIYLNVMVILFMSVGVIFSLITLGISYVFSKLRLF
ncbi:MAG: hypothetical protein LBN09_09365, partial [Clostridioides sp.]|jgi:hypothetical protein|nr:hypothetical protein [Clostridioides sp.]